MIDETIGEVELEVTEQDVREAFRAVKEAAGTHHEVNRRREHAQLLAALVTKRNRAERAARIERAGRSGGWGK